MPHNIDKETTGAWIIHHGAKIQSDKNGSNEFAALDIASKASNLLIKLGQNEQTTLSIAQVKAIAQSNHLNPKLELFSLIDLLKKKRLVDTNENITELSILGVNTRAVLAHATNIFAENEPSNAEKASIALAEKASIAPIKRIEISNEISDNYKISINETNDFLDRAETIGFVDKEGENDDKLLFNGNLFRRDNIKKTNHILSSLNTTEQQHFIQVSEELKQEGCLSYNHIQRKLSQDLLEKLIAAGIYDLNTVVNERGPHTYIISPSAFHKYVNPMIDDCFNMAKLLVSALTYGMKERQHSQGRIVMLDKLLRKLINGGCVGPATAIGNDYHALEVERVVQIIRDASNPSIYSMKLLKREVGELALEVMTNNSISNTSGNLQFTTSSMRQYISPEENRMSIRKKQSQPSKRHTQDILTSLRVGK